MYTYTPYSTIIHVYKQKLFAAFVFNSWGVCSDENINSGAILSFDVVCTGSPVTKK